MFKKNYIKILADTIALAFIPRMQLSRLRDYSADPLSHPDLSGMSLRQLADLPFEPRRVAGALTEPAARNAGKPAKRPANPASACIAATAPL